MTRILPVLMFLMLLALPATAQETAPVSKIPKKPQVGVDPSKTLEELSSVKPTEKFTSKKTDNLTVSMLFHKLTGQDPDFVKWAKTSKTYQNVSGPQQTVVLNEMTNRLKTKFSLMGINEPIHVEQYVTLKQYNPKSEGIFIEEFTPNTFYTYHFDNEYFAVIPSDLMDYQYLKIGSKKMAELKPHLTGKNQLFMRLSLVPIKGDAETKVRLSNGHQNWLLAAKVMDIELWSPKDKRLLWRSNEDFYSRKNQLLNLYQ